MKLAKLASIARRLARRQRPEMAAAREIRAWTDGPNPRRERVERLAKVIAELDREQNRRPG